MGRVKDIHVLHQHIDPETGASLVAHPEHHGEGVSPIPKPGPARDKLPNFRRGLGLYQKKRGGEVVNIGPGKYEYWANSTIAERYGEGHRYAGQIEMGEREVIASLSGGWCECKSYRKKQFVYQGITVCKHMWWAAIKASLGEFQNVQQIEIHHNSGELKSVKINGCKLRRAQADFGAFKGYVEKAGMGAWSFPEHGKDIPLDSNGLYGRVYTKKISDE